MRFGFTAALEVTIITMVSLVAMLLLGRWVIEHFAVPPAIGNPTSVLVAAVISMITLGVFPLPNSIEASDDISGWLGVSLTNLLFLYAAMAIASAARSRTSDIQEITDAIDDLQPRRRAAASFLHNSVNSTWRALAMQLELASRTGDVERARQLLADMRITGTEAQFIEHERSEGSALSAHADRWEGLAHVSVDVDGDVPARLRSPVSQLVDEAITNAVRHGRARHIEAFITVSAEHVDVVVVDDGFWSPSTDGTGAGTGSGTGSGAGSGTGLGTTWLGAQGAWSREHGPQGTRLTVRWPCLP
jgi:signal transduction histidine kinase